MNKRLVIYNVSEQHSKVCYKLMYYTICVGVCVRAPPSTQKLIGQAAFCQSV